MGFKVTSHRLEVETALPGAIEKALETCGLAAEGYAKRLCPVGTPESTGIPGYIGGTLRNSISHAVEGNVMYIGTNVYYGPYVEMGTVYRPEGKPFLKPALVKNAQEYKRILEQALKDT